MLRQTFATPHRYARGALRVAALAASLALAGCATVPNPSPDDPFEPWNRAMYEVHQVVDGKVIKPAVQAYVDYTPPTLRQGVSNFFGNVDDFISVFNDFLQGKLDKAGNDMGRVMVNSFFGLGGLIDIASDAGIEKGNEDFGQTFGYWGIAQGPYFFVPVLGPTTARDGTGLVVRAYASPLSYIVQDVPARNVLYGMAFVNARAQALQSESFVDQAALDRYTFIRRAYLQRRDYLVRDGKAAPMKEEP
jgi:phospholipid-binding lipoprotein MlaA